MNPRNHGVRRRRGRLALVAGAAALLAAGAALAQGAPSTAPAAKAAPPYSPCFFITQWDGWKAPSENVIYLGVNMHDVYQADLSVGSPQLMWPDVHLVHDVHGSNSVCSPLDLQLYVADSHGFRAPIIVKSLRKLSPEEAAAIPKKYRPH
jgi:hypothetical protein